MSTLWKTDVVWCGAWFRIYYSIKKMMNDGSKNMLSVSEVAGRLGVSRACVVRLIEAGDLDAIIVNPSVSERRHFRVMKSEVDEYIESVGRYAPEY